MTAYLLRLQDRHLAGERFHLDAGEFVLGRSSSCDLVVHDSSVSRRHAKIAVEDGTIAVTDLGSLNGTYLGGEQVRTVRAVAEGQTVRFGSVSFLVSTSQVCAIELDSALETDKCDQLADGRSYSPALSQSQTRVLERLLDGLAEKQIAARLCINRNTSQTASCYSTDSPVALIGAPFFSISGAMMLARYSVERFSGATT